MEWDRHEYPSTPYPAYSSSGNEKFETSWWTPTELAIGRSAKIWGISKY